MAGGAVRGGNPGGSFPALRASERNPSDCFLSTGSYGNRNSITAKVFGEGGMGLGEGRGKPLPSAGCTKQKNRDKHTANHQAGPVLVSVVLPERFTSSVRFRFPELRQDLIFLPESFVALPLRRCTRQSLSDPSSEYEFQHPQYSGCLEGCQRKMCFLYIFTYRYGWFLEIFTDIRRGSLD